MNKYPGLKKVLQTRLQVYSNIEVKWIGGAHPTAIFYENDVETDRVKLSDMQEPDFWALLEKRSFFPKTHRNPYNEAQTVLEWGGHRYELYSTGNPYAVASEFAASQVREGVAGHILTITSDAELEAVGAWLKESNVPSVLLGASDAGEEGRWTWIEGPESHTAFWSGNHAGTPVNSEFSRWLRLEPNNADGNEDCAHLYLLGEGGLPGFNDADCNNLSAWLVVEFGREVPTLPVQETVELHKKEDL